MMGFSAPTEESAVQIIKRKWQTAAGEEREAWTLDYSGPDRHDDGRLKRHILTFAKKRDAEAKAALLKAELAEGTYVHPKADETVREAAQGWLEACEKGRDGGHPLERHTLRQYDQHARQIIPLIGDKKVNQLTEAQIKRFRDSLLDLPRLDRAPNDNTSKISRATAKKIMASFRSILLEGGAGPRVI